MIINICNTTPKFAPIKIELVLENENDLLGLYNRMNILWQGTSKEYQKKVSPNKFDTCGTTELYRKLDAIVEERGLTPNAK